MKWEEVLYKIEIMHKFFPNQPKEIENGNKEYKWKLSPIKYNKNTNKKKFNKIIKYKCEKLASQMHWRCCEGNGNAVYILGIEDDGNPVGIKKYDMFKTLLFIIKASTIIHATINKIRLYKGPNGTIATVRISLNIEETKTL